MNQEICKNCSSPFSGFYCPQCGQKVIKTPLSISTIVSNVKSLIEFDKGFFHTFWILLSQPGKLIRDYLNGKSRPYNNPIRFFFSVIALIYLLEVAYRFYVSRQLEKEFVLSDLDDQLEYTFNTFNLTIVLFTALFNYTLFRSKFNFTEHLTIMLYQLSMYYFLALIIVQLFYFGLFESFAGQTFMILMILVVVPFIAFRFSLQVFKGKKIIIILKSILYYSAVTGAAMVWRKL